MVRRRRPAACSPTSGDEQTPQIHISTSTRLQRAFECTAHDALDTLKLLSNAPSTRPQRALNAPSKGSNVLTMHPRPQCPQRDSNTPSRCPSCTPHKVCLFNQFYGKNLQVLFLSLAPPTGTRCFFLRAILGCDTTPLVPLRLIIGCPPPPRARHPPRPARHLGTTLSLAAFCVSNGTLDAPLHGEGEGHIAAHFARAHHSHTPHPVRHFATTLSLAAFRVSSSLTTFRVSLLLAAFRRSSLNAHSVHRRCCTPVRHLCACTILGSII